MALEQIIVCTRGSALALAQTYGVVAECRAAFPKIDFRVDIIKTTGDKLQTASLAHSDADSDALPRGLFTKELEQSLLDGTAAIAIHSLKDLPTELPAGLVLGATPQRADVRDVLIYRGPDAAASRAKVDPEWRPGSKPRWHGMPGVSLGQLPKSTCVATSSTRRAAQVQEVRSDAKIVPIRGNVGTRLQKLADDSTYDALLLAAAGLGRLGLFIAPKSRLTLEPRLDPRHRFSPPPAGLLATVLDEELILPAVGQGALALEIKADARSIVREVCEAMNHRNTFAAITAERAFLRAMGGGCQSPVGAYARVVGHQLWLRVVSYQDGTAQRAENRLAFCEAVVDLLDLLRVQELAVLRLDAAVLVHCLVQATIGERLLRLGQDRLGLDALRLADHFFPACRGLGHARLLGDLWYNGLRRRSLWLGRHLGLEGLRWLVLILSWLHHAGLLLGEQSGRRHRPLGQLDEP